MTLFGSAITSSTGPAATTCPPRTPGPGPKSTMWSAARIVSSSCSTTTTVLPWSRSRASVSSRRSLSRGMQADRRLVEDVEHADQPAADLPGQADALHLAAGKRGRGAVEREIFEADVLEELQPAANFLEHFGGDLLAGRVQLQLAEELLGVGDGQRADLGQRCVRAGRRTRGTRLVTVTARACGFSRAPWQRPQPRTHMYFSNWRRCMRLCVVRYCESSLGMMPSNLPPHL